MEFSARQIADLLNGEVVGNEEVTVNDIAKIEEGKEGQLSFLANDKYEDFLYVCQSSIVIVNKDFEPREAVNSTLVKVDDAYGSFAMILNEYQKFKTQKSGIHGSAVIEESAHLGDNLYIGAQAYIGENVTIGNNVKIYPQCFIGDNVTIGDDCTIYAGVKIYYDTIIGKQCIIHAGTIVGGDGFGFAPNSENVYAKVAQVGNVILEDYVEIGANTAIDRATMGSTIIRKGVKLDNLIQVAHNVEIGENTVIAAQTGIAGSTKIGKNCMIGGQVGIVGHIEIADEVKIAAQSGVGSSIKKVGAIVQGSPAFDIGDYKRSYVYFRQLPSLMAKIKN